MHSISISEANSMTADKKIRLSNGVEIPAIGLGTWQTGGETTEEAVKSALKAGYRLIDTAAAYGNERSVGKAIRESGINRSEVFVTSKLRNACHTYTATMEAFELTLNRLGLDYLDLYLIHWPKPLGYRTIWKEATLGTWKAFNELYSAGKIKAIGVSNFMPHHIDLLLQNGLMMPMVNQLKLCPGTDQPAIVDYCRKRGIVIEAYSPFGTGSVFESDEMKALAEKYGISVAKLCLVWCIGQGFIPLPKSSNPTRIKENLQVFDVEISKEDIDRISAIKDVCGEAPNPDTVTY